MNTRPTVISRRKFLNLLMTASIIATSDDTISLAQPVRNKDSIVFLGTQGGPNFNLERGESASALIIDGQPYLIDCGYGALRALLRADISYLDIAQIFLTHLHDDHVADIAALVGHQWTQGRVALTKIFGPYGTDQLIKAAVDFNQANTRIRLVDEARSLLPKDLFTGISINATQEPQQVFKDDRVVVLSIENTHYSESAKDRMPDRSLAFRFDSDNHSVVFSGDTGYSENLITLAKGADFFVCEAMDIHSMRRAFDDMVANGGYGDNPEGVWKHIVETHSTTQDAGRMAAAAKVKALVINHVIPGALQDVPDSTYLNEIAKHYSGNIVIAKDQMVLPGLDASNR